MSKENDIEGEQVRGLYIVGLLAILVTLKLTVQVDPFTDQVLYYVITSWAVYSFCMIFAYSNLPKSLAVWFKGIAEIFLAMSFIASVGYFLIITFVMFELIREYAILLYLIFAFVIAFYIRFARPRLKSLIGKRQNEEVGTESTNQNHKEKDVNRDTELLKVQVYVGYCHSEFRSRISYVFGGIVAVYVSLMGLFLQKTIDALTYYLSLAAGAPIFALLLWSVYRNYHKSLSKVDRMIELVNKGDSLPSVEDMIKGKEI